MQFLIKMAKKLFGFLNFAPDTPNIVVSSVPDKQTSLGKVLVSYLEYVIFLNDDDSRFSGHSNNWESREIIRIFNKIGYEVDAINWTDNEFVPTENYQAVFDIHSNLQRLAPILPRNTKKILHLTGSYTLYQNSAELKRIDNLRNRTGFICSPRRVDLLPEVGMRSLDLADTCTLIGNEHTLLTYPQCYWDKIQLVTVSASKLSHVKKTNEMVPVKREFLFYYGGGAIHKGLDLLLEVFSKNVDLILNVVGNYDSESDFMTIYGQHLNNLPNIKYHGFVYPDSDRYNDIVKNIFCFIAPSCSEAISTAVATCLQVGLFPIISRDNGVTLPEGTGLVLQECSVDEIELAVWKAYRMDDYELLDQIVKCQNYALERFSRNRFSEDMTRVLTKIMSE